MKTRKQLAAELWERLRRGPSIGTIEQSLTPEEFSTRYRGWAESWILDDVARLVPELRHHLGPLGTVKRPEAT